MHPRIAHWLGLEPDDEAAVASLAMPFAMSAAAATLVATGTKAAFLAEHPIAKLPWVLGAQSIWAIGSALLFARLAQSASARRRATVSLVLAAATLVLARASIGAWPAGGAFAAILVGPAVVQLAIAQVWTAVALLPPRQAKRTLPVLGTLATVGAAGGGALAGGLVRVIHADDLMIVTAALLAVSTITLRPALRRFERDAEEADEPPPRRGEVAPSFFEVARFPLVVRLALVVALVQAGSVVLDVQLSGELKRSLDREDMAAFLGVFYALTNTASLLVGVGATPRLLRIFGLGLCVACTAAAHLLGSAGYLALALTGAAPVLLALGLGAGLERVGQYSIGRTALAMTLAPLDERQQGAARTIVEIVAYRGATLGASVGLLFLGDVPLHSLAPWAIVASVLALALAGDIGARYRRTLYVALRGGPLDEMGHARFVVDCAVVSDVLRGLGSTDPESVGKALEIVHSLAVPVPAETLARLACSPDPRIAPRALEAFAALDMAVPQEVFETQLAPDCPDPILRAALAALPVLPSAAVRKLATALTTHPDACVARLAQAASARQGMGSGEGAARPLRSMLQRGGMQTQLLAIDALGQAQIKGSEADLVKSLEDPALRTRATAALVRFGSALAPIGARALARPETSHEARAALVGALERTGMIPCRDVLLHAAGFADRRLRDASIAALFRMGRTPALRPDPGWSKARAKVEIAELRALRGLPFPEVPAGRAILAKAEVEERMRRAERRAILLLGLLHGRRQLYRVAIEARSPSARARSTAVELLDEHVKDPELRDIVPLMEGKPTEASEDADREALADDGWLGRLLRWSNGEEDVGLDAAERLQRVPLLAGLGAEALEPLARSMSLRRVAPGEALARAGEVPDALFVVLEGALRIELEGATPVGPGECVGGLGLLDRTPRSADVTATEPVLVASLGAADFDAHLAAYPSFARGLLQVVTGRFRASIERSAPT